MLIFIRTRTGTQIPFNVETNEKIETLKKKIQNKLGIIPEKQYLIFLERCLQDEKTIDEYGIRDDCILELIVPSKTTKIT